MRVVYGEMAALPSALREALGRYRYRVFIEMLGWRLPTSGGIETDQFDREDALYVTVLDAAGEIVGCARLLPTTRPYLLSEIFPDLLHGTPPPCSDKVWELSRFASVDLRRHSSAGEGQFSSPATRLLLDTSIALAAARGAEQLISVSPLGVARLLRKLGVSARRAGPVTLVEGHPTFACWIDVAGTRRVDAPAVPQRTTVPLPADAA